MAVTENKQCNYLDAKNINLSVNQMMDEVMIKSRSASGIFFTVANLNLGGYFFEVAKLNLGGY